MHTVIIKYVMIIMLHSYYIFYHQKLLNVWLEKKIKINQNLHRYKKLVLINFSLANCKIIDKKVIINENDELNELKMF